MKDESYLLKHIDKFVNEAMTEIAWNKYRKASLICEKEIDRFYNEYSPMVYNRKHDLYNAYNLSVKNGEFIFELGSEFMQKKHRVSNEYIYEKMFKEGWHGGADDGQFHPEPGKNYWRTPHEDDTEHDIEAYSYWWSKPAAKSSSPYNNIVNKWNLYMNKEGKNMELNVWASTAKKYLRR